MDLFLVPPFPKTLFLNQQEPLITPFYLKVEDALFPKLPRGETEQSHPQLLEDSNSRNNKRTYREINHKLNQM